MCLPRLACHLRLQPWLDQMRPRQQQHLLCRQPRAFEAAQGRVRAPHLTNGPASREALHPSRSGSQQRRLRRLTPNLRLHPRQQDGPSAAEVGTQPLSRMRTRLLMAMETTTTLAVSGVRAQTTLCRSVVEARGGGRKAVFPCVTYITLCPPTPSSPLVGHHV
jgi:hypothetical protein